VAGFLCRLGVGRSELDDAVQEVFIVAHRSGGFKVGGAQPTTWLAEIALRVASGQKRSHRRRLQRETDVATDDVEHATPFDTLAKRESRDRIASALETLSLEHRAVFILYEIEGESCESIADGLEIPLGTVYSRLHHARERFKQAYGRLATEPKSANSCDQKGTL
jgi:RNA polymerase sigma-70 factor (ECF subfamily)